MKAWLERVEPPGEPISLPDGSGALVFGRSPRVTVVFDCPGVSPRHWELAWDSGFWRVRDLGSEHGTRVNGHAVTSVWALFCDDVVSFGDARVRFKTDLPREDPALLTAIAAHPDAEEPWLVYADQLQENGDPLGERIVRARSGGRLDHQPWLGPLWDALVAGSLEVEWQHGFVRRATIRTAAGRLPLDWRATVSTLVNLRVGKFLQGLTIDVARLEHVPLLRLAEALVEAQRSLAALPGLPPTLSSLSLGYHLSPALSQGSQVLDALAARAPRLTGSSVYTRAVIARLRLVSRVDGVAVSGMYEGMRAVNSVLRVRKGNRHQLHLESPPGIPFLADGNPCYFAHHDSRVQLIAGRMRGEVRVNQRIDSLFELLPGDLVDVQGAARFRFEVG